MNAKKAFTRAEIARQRRAQRAAKELTQTGRRASQPIAPVVVSRKALTRGAVAPAPVAKKRRFSIALGATPEINLRRPTIVAPSLLGGRRLTSLVIVIFLSATIYFALTLPLFRVPSVTTLGNQRISRDDITAALGVLGQSIFTVRPDEAEMRLRMNYPELISAQVNVYLPNHVYVTVVERQPVILWKQGDAYTWIDAEGVAFRPHGKTDKLVSVVGLAVPPQGVTPADNPLSPPPFMQKELANAILSLAPNVPADTTMIYDQTFGLGWEDTRGWKAFFGTSVNDMPLKARVYQSLVETLVARGKKPAFIGVMYPDAPFYRMAAETQVKKPVAVNGGQ
jgi:hypothetical protein